MEEAFDLLGDRDVAANDGAEAVALLQRHGESFRRRLSIETAVFAHEFQAGVRRKIFRKAILL